MKNRIANVLLALSVCAASVFVSVIPVVASPKPNPTNGPPGCVWEWTAFGWLNVRDQCFGFCNYPDHNGAFIGDLASTPCLG